MQEDEKASPGTFGIPGGRHPTQDQEGVPPVVDGLCQGVRKHVLRSDGSGHHGRAHQPQVDQAGLYLQGLHSQTKI